jgi:hypothetical protein
MTARDPIRVNRAPVLTLWAAVVAERLGHPPDTALSLGSAVAGTAARAKARRLGIAEDHAPQDAHPTRDAPRQAVPLLGRQVAVTQAADGTLRAAGPDGAPAPPEPVRRYVERAFGTRLGEVRAAMEALAASLPPEELNRAGFRLYEAFRPDVPDDVRGWGAKGALHLERIRSARA